MNNLQPFKMLETDIKSVILNYLRNKGELCHSSTIISELTVNKFSRRVDLAIIEKGKAYAFEIKSAADSLNRLEGQVTEYLNYFDKVIVVADSRHANKILSLVPRNVGVWEIRANKVVILQRGMRWPLFVRQRFQDLRWKAARLMNTARMHNA